MVVLQKISDILWSIMKKKRGTIFMFNNSAMMCMCMNKLALSGNSFFIHLIC